MTDVLHIDWTLCRGHGSCTELLDGLLRRDDWGFPLGPDRLGNDVRIPAGREDDARDAAALCPRLALALRAVS